MDAEFVEFLDKKFQTIERTLRTDIQETSLEIQEVRSDLSQQIAELRESVNTLANAVDKFIHMHEKLEVE